LIMISAAVGIGVLTGAYRFERGTVSVSVLALYMVGFIVQGMSEEVVCRGYLMVSISRKNPVWLAVLLSSLVFAVLHLGNPGVSLLAFINLVLFGVIFAVYILKRGNIWGACALHSFWNFFQGNVFGISVSGSGVTDSPLIARAQGAELWSGGAFGIEGSLCVTIVGIAALLILVFLVPEKKDEFTPPAPPAEV
ncbi:MAG: CPBP family intramembrane metalloprotease, partial [Oscillospiraceae bacterium]|nr:CPBP family intramembrane metalloprotease [Oscillospiraceae bacterium]